MDVEELDFCVVGREICDLIFIWLILVATWKIGKNQKYSLQIFNFLCGLNYFIIWINSLQFKFYSLFKYIACSDWKTFFFQTLFEIQKFIFAGIWAAKFGDEKSQKFCGKQIAAKHRTLFFR